MWFLHTPDTQNLFSLQYCDIFLLWIAWKTTSCEHKNFFTIYGSCCKIDVFSLGVFSTRNFNLRNLKGTVNASKVILFVSTQKYKKELNKLIEKWQSGTKWVCGQYSEVERKSCRVDLSGRVSVSCVIPDKWQNYPMCWHVERAGPLSTPISRRWITHTHPFITTAAEQHSAASDTHTHTHN